MDMVLKKIIQGGMEMVLQHNIEAWNANRNLNVVTKRQAKSTEKLSAGYKINRAADDAAGLTISEGMRSMIRGLNRASNNAEDGYSLLQTADGALEEIHSILQRGRELSVQAANDSNTEIDRQAIQSEVDELLIEINRIADTTEFNTLKLLDGSKSGDPNANPLIRQKAAEGVMREGIQQVNPGVITNPAAAGSVSRATAAEETWLKNELTNNMVPKAVGGILSTFSGAFANNPNISTTIGTQLYTEPSSTLAYVACRYSYDASGKIASMELNLSVNLNSLTFSGGQLTAISQKALEGTIAHEMMHAFMDDGLPNGMIGINSSGVIDKSNQFPKWFKEGMAQTAAGGCSNYNDWVNGGLGLHANMPESSISAVVTDAKNKLSSGSTASQYGTGYLACMYLGYLADGTNTVSSAAIGSGLDKILTEMKNGKTLNQVINDISGGKYISISDFQRKFGDSDSSHFISLLLKEAGNIGSGSVIAPNLGVADVLDNAAPNTNYYLPDFTQQFTPSSATTFTGGGSGGYNGNGEALMLQVGSLGHQGIGISIDDAHTDALGLGSVSVMSFEEAGTAISDFDYAIDMVSSNRSSIGAYMNRLEHTIANIDNTSENIQAAESRVRDTDMADEMVEYSASNIIAQAGQSMLAQANQNRQGILQLLQ